MAEETDKSNSTGETSSAPNVGAAGSSDMIDLEGLVRNIDLTPTDSIAVAKLNVAGTQGAEVTSGDVALSEEQPPAAERNSSEAQAAQLIDSTEPVQAEVPLHAEALDPAKLDEILNIEDPEMAAQVEAIRAAGFEKGESDSTIEEDEDSGVPIHQITKLSLREKFHFKLLKVGAGVRSFRTLAIRSVKDSKGLLRELLGKAKTSFVLWLQKLRTKTSGGIDWLKSRSLAQKMSLLVAIVVLGLLIFVGAKTIQGTLLPTVERAWIANFTEFADGKFTYESNGSFEDFNDPLLHPEFVILVERIVVNLSRTPQAPESANPMAAFELYLQTDNQDAAVEIKDRSVEIRDAVARSVERMTYPDLADEDGKAKLKLLIRKDLNEIITRGKVRRVFFKTIVLNPES